MREIRISLISITIILICIGVVMIFSSSCVYALQQLGNSAYFLIRHLLFLFFGLIFVILTMSMDSHQLKKFSKIFLLIGILLLIAVLIPGIGKESYGARRWFKLWIFSFQPSEFVKIAMLIYAADYLSRKQNKIKNFLKGFLPLVIVLGAVCLLILKEPDLGTSVFLAVVILLMMLVAGVRVLHVGFLALLALPVIYFLIAKVPYRLARIMAFLNPWEDSQGIGFQLSQSQIALGSGGVFGVGLGKSIQKLFYLPAAHTDFIFSIIGEELGLIVTLTVIILFLLFIWQGARIVKRTTDGFGYLLGAGIVIMIGLQAVINIGVSIGALPTKGLPLPFISYGGSALIANMLAVGLLLNISRMEET